MEEYLSNSHKSREKGVNKQIKPVITGNAKIGKKSGLTRLTDIFRPDDISDVKGYLLKDILIPEIRETVYEILRKTIDGLFSHGKSRGTNYSSYTSASRISYSSSYTNPTRTTKGPNTVDSSFNYENIIFDKRGDAEAVLIAMQDIISQYKAVSVADLYDLAEISTSNYSLNNYGWTDINTQNSKIVRTTEGYKLFLPKATPLN